MGTFNVIQVQDISTQTLEESMDRAFKFLKALGGSLEIRGKLDRQGYTQADHLEGWRLLAKASGSERKLTISRGGSDAALRELDAWDELGFRKAHSALFRTFPAQVAFLFEDLAPTQGPDAILGVMKFLDRIDALEKGRTPETEADDKKAVDTLATRGIDADERARLRSLVDLAQSAPQGVAAAVANAAQEHTDDMRALYAWYVQWSEIARLVVKGRTEQVALGIRKRRREKSTAVAPVAPVVPNTPVTSPAAAATAPVVVTAPETTPSQAVMRVAANG